jgi:twinkle protein
MATIFDWGLIDSTKTTGTAKLKCPNCIDSRRDKRDRPLFVSFDSGVAKCFNCEALSFRDSVKKETEKKYTIPVQDWKNYTNLTDGLVKYFENRGIQQYVLKEMNITEEKYFQPQMNKEVNNVVFNYFESDTIVNKKYRSGNKKFTQSKNGKPIFYNINSAIGAEEVYIVEGEIDVLSFIQIGVKAVLSVPNGANDNDAYWINSEPYLKGVKKYYIATDKDEKGNDLAEKIAQRLGRYRCERINFEGKDANDDLKSGILEKSILNTSRYPVSGTFTVMDMYDKMMTLYDNGLPPTLTVKNPCFGNFNEIFKPMLGHLVVGTGIPSHGKSNFTEWYVLNLINENDLKASFFSPEHQPMELHQSTFVQKVIGKNYFFEIEGTPRVSKEEISQYAQWANEKLYLTSPEDGNFANWDWVFEKFREQMFSFGINIFVIDAYNKVEHTGNRTERENITKVLSRLTQFAQSNNVMIILIAHPTKMKRNQDGTYEEPTLYDVSGSADFRNQTHDGFCIYRYFGDLGHTSFTNLKVKYSFQGKIGEKIDYYYHTPSGRYYGLDCEKPVKSFFDKPIEKEQLQIPLGNTNDAFGEPFNEQDEILF